MLPAGAWCWPAGAPIALQRGRSSEAGGGDALLAVPTDVTQPAQVDALFAATLQRFGRVDLVFNNAGISANGIAFEDLSADTWRSVVVDVNLTGTFPGVQGERIAR